MEYTLRPARDEDREFLFRLRAASLGPYVAQIWGWDEDEQRERFERSFDPAHYRIVQMVDDIGAIEVERREHEYYLGNVELLPEHQEKGIGTELIRSVLAAANREKVPVVLQVFKINPARSLYERLGFVTIGETSTHYQMYHPASAG